MTATTPAQQPDLEPLTWGRHYRALERHTDVAAVDTPAVQRVGIRMREAVRDRVTVVVTGDPGVGKSFALGRGAEAVEAAGVQVQWLELSPSSRELGLFVDLYEQVTGLTAPKRTSIHQMVKLLQATFSSPRRLVVFDEAQFANESALRNLRWLQEKSTSDFGLVIAGTRDLWKKLPREIRSRAAFHVEIDRIGDGDIVPILTNYHPVFTRIDREFLTDLNRQRAHGSFRWWAKFLNQALNHLDVTVDRIDEGSLELVLADVEDG